MAWYRRNHWHHITEIPTISRWLMTKVLNALSRHQEVTPVLQTQYANVFLLLNMFLSQLNQADGDPNTAINKIVTGITKCDFIIVCNIINGTRLKEILERRIELEYELENVMAIRKTSGKTVTPQTYSMILRAIDNFLNRI